LALVTQSRGGTGPPSTPTGEITACNPDGTFDILYEDGDTEVGVLTQFVKPFYAPRDWPDRALAMH